jgi:hypothetical protein
MTLKLKPLHSKGQRYTYYYHCKNDGDIFLVLKLHRNFNDTWRAKMTTERVTEEQIVELRRAIDISTMRRKIKKKNGYFSKRQPRQCAKNTESGS